MAKSLLDKRLSTPNTQQVNKPEKIKKSKPPKTNELLSSRLNNKSEDNKKSVEPTVEEDNKPVNRFELSLKDTNKPIKKEKVKKITEEEKNTLDIDTILMKEGEFNEELKVTSYKNQRVKAFIRNVCIMVGCLYFIVLIFGALITDYTYDEAGNAVPMAMSYSDLKNLDDFKVIVTQYYAIQELYRQMLDIDYQLYVNPSNAMALSVEYEGLLEEVSRISIKTESIAVNTAYSRIKTMLLSWIKNDIAVYLQNMSSAIAENNSTKEQHAAEDRNRVLNNYNMITNNLVALGEKVKGMDVNELVEWTPEKYNKELMGE